MRWYEPLPGNQTRCLCGNIVQLPDWATSRSATPVPLSSMFGGGIKGAVCAFLLSTAICAVLALVAYLVFQYASGMWSSAFSI